MVVRREGGGRKCQTIDDSAALENNRKVPILKIVFTLSSKEEGGNGKVSEGDPK